MSITNPIYDTDEHVECTDCPCDAQVWIEIDGKPEPMCNDCAGWWANHA